MRFLPPSIRDSQTSLVMANKVKFVRTFLFDFLSRGDFERLIPRKLEGYCNLYVVLFLVIDFCWVFGFDFLLEYICYSRKPWTCFFVIKSAKI